MYSYKFVTLASSDTIIQIQEVTFSASIASHVVLHKSDYYYYYYYYNKCDKLLEVCNYGCQM